MTSQRDVPTYYTSIDKFTTKRTIEEWLPLIDVCTVIKDVGSYQRCIEIRNMLGREFVFTCYGPTYTMCILNKK